ncbi:unnamed protein product [Amoebophrya sp. A25]|nr:unnamed protein product [Amoebophrya sp. A25]|eukprot:GSA25T00004800001.1
MGEIVRHLVILQHGIQGCVGDFKNLLTTFEAWAAPEKRQELIKGKEKVDGTGRGTPLLSDTFRLSKDEESSKAAARQESSSEGEDDSDSLSSTSKAYKNVETVFYAAKSLDRWFGTNDGVANGARLVAKEIIEILEKSIQEKRPVRYLSVIGHSLGGIYLRYVLKLLQDRDWLIVTRGGGKETASTGLLKASTSTSSNGQNLPSVEAFCSPPRDDDDQRLSRTSSSQKIELRTFMTLASPHLGIRRPMTAGRGPDGLFNRVFMYVATSLTKSVQDLCLAGDVDCDSISCNSEDTDRDSTSLNTVTGRDGVVAGAASGASSSRSSAEGLPQTANKEQQDLNKRKKEGPLLHQMATRSAFLRPLRAFRRRVLYANVFHDHLVPYCTASIRPANPYRRSRSTAEQRATFRQREGANIKGRVASSTRKNDEDEDVLDDEDDNGEDVEQEDVLGGVVSHERETSCKWVYKQPRPRPALVDQDLYAFARHDSRKRELREMLVSLNSLEWERVDVNLSSVAAHWLICGQIKRLSLLDHIAENLIKGDPLLLTAGRKYKVWWS